MRQLQIGTLQQLQQPALVPYAHRQPWLLVQDAATATLAAELAEAIILQLLRQHATGQAQALLFETSPGPCFARLKRVLAASEQQWGEQIYTARDCLKRLTELEELAHRRFALLAQSGMPDMIAYNAQATRREPIIYLVLNGLGSALSEPQPLQQLDNLCRQGAAVGIIPVLLQNTQEHLDPQTPELRRKALQAFWPLVQAQAIGMDVTSGLQPIHLPAELWRLLTRFGLQAGVGEAALTTWADALLEQSQQPQDAHGEQDFLHIPIGLSGANPACFDMGEKSDVYHALVGGATRTGKTTLLNNLILTACETCPPEQLQFTLMDFKDGVSFWEYEGLAHVEHSYAPVEPDFSTALACLARFAQHIGHRNALFRTQRVARLADYNRVAPEPLPRCVLVVDEVQSLFEGQDYKQKAEVKRILSTVAKKGAAAGLHMILSTQSFQNVDLDGDVKEQFHLRIGLRHATAMGCRALMGRDNDAMLTLPRFTAIYNGHQGEERYNRTVALSALPDFHARLDAVKTRYPATPRSTSEPHQGETFVRDHLTDGDVSEPW